MSKDEWLTAIGMTVDEIPEKIILEGTWWQKERYPVRLEYLTKVRELKFPDMYLGEYEGSKVMFCCAYGAPRAVEPVHIFGVLGTKKVIQIGSCGGLQPNIQTGDIVIPTTSFIGEGASQYYGQLVSSTATQGLVESADRVLTNLGLKTFVGAHISTSALLQQSDEVVEKCLSSCCSLSLFSVSLSVCLCRTFSLSLCASLLFLCVRVVALFCGVSLRAAALKISKFKFSI